MLTSLLVALALPGPVVQLDPARWSVEPRGAGWVARCRFDGCPTWIDVRVRPASEVDAELLASPLGRCRNRVPPAWSVELDVSGAAWWVDAPGAFGCRASGFDAAMFAEVLRAIGPVGQVDVVLDLGGIGLRAPPGVWTWEGGGVAWHLRRGDEVVRVVVGGSARAEAPAESWTNVAGLRVAAWPAAELAVVSSDRGSWTLTG
ncbi:MAG TPA: hypothetical protein PKA64_24940, partial [Myxococcota bacterium]|nr:hypothetical protein [Myxococcota bacterium]